MAASIRCDLYVDVTNRTLAELEAGAALWVKPWSATPGQNVPQNAVTNRPYSGCNVILLWLTRGRGANRRTRCCVPHCQSGFTRAEGYPFPSPFRFSP